MKVSGTLLMLVINLSKNYAKNVQNIALKRSNIVPIASHRAWVIIHSDNIFRLFVRSHHESAAYHR